MEESLQTDNSLVQSHFANNVVNIQGQEYVKSKFRKQLYIITIILSMILLGTFLGIFIYYLQNKMLGGKDVIVPNHYLIKASSFTQNSVTLHAQYQGDNIDIYPNIYPYITVNISLSNVKSSNTQGNFSFLQVDISEDQDMRDFLHKDYNIHSHKFAKANQLELKDVDLGPFDLEYASQGSKLAFIISRNSTGEKIFDTLDFNILVSQYFSTIGTFIPSGQFYGLGERRTSYFEFERQGIIKNCTYGSCNKYRFWNRNPLYNQYNFDQGFGNGSLSGYHPVYLFEEDTQNYSLVYIENAYSGLEIDYYQKSINAENQESLIFSTYDEKISFRIFLGDSNPETAVQQYHYYIGRFSLIPFWALGYHHSKLFNGENILPFLDSIQKQNLPIDAVWTNIEINEAGNQYKLLNQGIIDTLTKMRDSYQIKWIPQLPTLLNNADSCKEYVQNAIDQNVLLLSNKTKQPYLGSNILFKSYQLDFNHVNTSKYFAKQLSDLFAQVNFDGIWFYKNEPSSSETGEFVNNKLVDSNGYFDEIYKQITNFNFNDHLINIDALHYNKPDAPYFYHPEKGGYLYEKDLHSSNGHMQSSTTYDILKSQLQQTQPFIISSSNRPGTGMYAAHSTGAVVNDWSILQSSYIEIFNFQLYGIPFTGGNICPLNIVNDNNVAQVSELCARWYQAASVYPFMHSTQYNKDGDDPYFFKDYPFVFNSVKDSLKLRYCLLKHYYSLYVLKKGRGMIFKPVGFVFPESYKYAQFLANANNTAMIGDSLYVYTVMVPGDQSTNSTEVKLAIPPNLWVNLVNTHIQYKGPFQAKYNFPFSSSPLIFLREGHLILWQNINDQQHVRATLLNSTFVIKGVLTQINQDNLTIKYQSIGKTLGIIDYKNNEALEKCGNQGCELDITINVTSSNNKQLEIEINFVSQENQYFESGLEIQEIQLSGILKYNEIILQYCQSQNLLTTPFDYITVNKQFSDSETLIIDSKNKTFNISISI